ncbi:MAG: hypothetical protein OEV42_01740 [Deltaproteobacteria bacterium]|nr:hypothetical protein [Deltaproteobacteria bacterium]
MQTRLCPQCGAEYFSHVDSCADCHVPLKDFLEIEKENEEKERFYQESGGEIVPVKEGNGPWLKELRRVLLDKGIESCISLAPGCKPGNCSSTSLLFIAKNDLESAEKCLNEYYLSTHPESNDVNPVEEENCPACGYHAPEGVKECPDCGLVLIFEEY